MKNFLIYMIIPLISKLNFAAIHDYTDPLQGERNCWVSVKQIIIKIIKLYQ